MVEQNTPNASNIKQEEWELAVSAPSQAVFDSFSKNEGGKTKKEVSSDYASQPSTHEWKISGSGLLAKPIILRLTPDLLTVEGSWYSQGKGSLGKGELSLSGKEIIGIGKTTSFKLGLIIRAVVILLCFFLVAVIFDGYFLIMAFVVTMIALALILSAFSASMVILTTSGSNVVIPVGSTSLPKAVAFRDRLVAEITRFRAS